MQAGVEFFTKGVVNKSLTLDAALALERWRDELQRIVRLTTRLCACVAFMTAGVIDQIDKSWRKFMRQQLFDALGARKSGFVVCQWIVRISSAAHTLWFSNVQRV